jgi:tetratricopeptide (TPR) repeat protein
LLKRYPDYYRIYISLGKIEDNFELAADYFKKAMELEPASAFIVASHGYEIIECDHEEAMAAADKALGLDPSCHIALMIKAKVNMENKDYEHAKVYLEAARELAPYHIDIYHLLFQVY